MSPMLQESFLEDINNILNTGEVHLGPNRVKSSFRVLSAGAEPLRGG